MATQLVPGSSGTIALALDEVADERFTQLQIQIADSLDPDRCRADLLPWLAYSRGVDVWSPEWSEAEKRAYIRDFLKNARKRGTPNGLKDELGVLANEVIITEWFDAAAAPGTATVDVTGGASLYSQAAQDTIAEAARRNSPHTRDITVVIAFTIDIPAYPAPAIRSETLAPTDSNLPLLRP